MRRPLRATALAAVIPLAWALASCAADGTTVSGGTSSGNTSSGNTVSGGDAVGRVSAELGQGAHDVIAPVVGGGTIALTEYESKPLALWFWAPT